MNSITTIQLLKSTIGHPITRKILSGFSYCGRCGKHRIEIELELYTGDYSKADPGCIRNTKKK